MGLYDMQLEQKQSYFQMHVWKINEGTNNNTKFQMSLLIWLMAML